MSRGRNNHYTQEQCNHVAKLRQQGLSWRIIRERLGVTDWACKHMMSRAR